MIGGFDEKRVRNVFLILFIVIVCYITFVLVDCQRLRKSTIGTRPIITIHEMEEECNIKYNGLGYSVQYKIYCTEEIGTDRETVPVVTGAGSVFKWFGIIIWSWEL